MTDTNVAIRLKLFIESKGLSYSQFADECGIPRPSLSQLITGRNKKISDVLVGQIHNAFPDLNILWLLFNEGGMLASNSATSIDVTPQSSPSGDMSVQIDSLGLFDTSSFDDKSNNAKNMHNVSFQTEIFQTNQSGDSVYSKEKPLSQSKISSESFKNELVEANIQIRKLKNEIDKFRKNPRRVTQIMVYYDDFTFETFVPKHE